MALDIRSRRKIHPYRLSESSLHLLQACERKFELARLLSPPEEYDEMGISAPAVRGQAFGVGIQHYMLTGDMEETLYRTWLAYTPEVEDIPKRITLWRCINNLIACKDTLDALRRRYEVAIFNGKPAVELSYRLDIDEKWHYVGFIDIVLRDKVSGIYCVFECKTTSFKMVDLRPIYRNSGQALGYSIAIDQIVGENQSRYGVIYFVCRDRDAADNFVPDVYVFPFTKTLVDRLRWFYGIGMDVQRLNTMLSAELFPMRGDSCVRFNRVCPFYGTCNLTATDRPREIPAEEVQYDFRYNLDDVIQDHIARVKEEELIKHSNEVEEISVS